MVKIFGVSQFHFVGDVLSHEARIQFRRVRPEAPELYVLYTPLQGSSSRWAKPLHLDFSSTVDSERPILVSRLQGSGLVRYEAVDRRMATKCTWHGEATARTSQSVTRHLTLPRCSGNIQAVYTHRIISLKDGAGFCPPQTLGQYTLTARVLKSRSPEDIARCTRPSERPAVGTFPSSKLVFCLRSLHSDSFFRCTTMPRKRLLRLSAPSTPISLDIRQLGIPSGRAEERLYAPLLR